jgi:hypothetical protein
MQKSLVPVSWSKRILVAGMHHLRCELHLHLPATLPELFDCLLERRHVARVPVYMLDVRL